jgi:hypothetical protein
VQGGVIKALQTTTLADLVAFSQRSKAQAPAAAVPAPALQVTQSAPAA